VRGIKQTAKIIFSLFTGMAIGAALACLWVFNLPQSSLTADLDRNFDAASAQFDSRVRAEFPIGTPAWKLTNRLEREGFKPTWILVNQELSAYRCEGNFVCNIAARDYRRPAQNNTIETIRGVYREEGCL
jgi:hypothetical protein